MVAGRLGGTRDLELNTRYHEAWGTGPLSGPFGGGEGETWTPAPPALPQAPPNPIHQTTTTTEDLQQSCSPRCLPGACPQPAPAAYMDVVAVQSSAALFLRARTRLSLPSAAGICPPPCQPAAVHHLSLSFLLPPSCLTSPYPFVCCFPAAPCCHIRSFNLAAREAQSIAA